MKATLSLEENIETLKRSKLPTIVTEGADDYQFFRRLEDELKDLGVSLFPAGGKTTALEIFNRRKEIGRNNVAFLIDSDLWVFSGRPSSYEHRKVICTDGYSIENDLYRDGELECLLTEAEKGVFAKELDSIGAWYSFCVSKLLVGEEATISIHPKQILDEGGIQYLNGIGYSGPSEQIYALVKSNYDRLLRGKTLLHLLARQLSAAARQTKFGRHQIMEIGAARKGPHFRRISDNARALFLSLE